MFIYKNNQFDRLRSFFLTSEFIFRERGWATQKKSINLPYLVVSFRMSRRPSLAALWYRCVIISDSPNHKFFVVNFLTTISQHCTDDDRYLENHRKSAAALIDLLHILSLTLFGLTLLWLQGATQVMTVENDFDG